MKSHLTRDFRVCFASLPERIQRLARENYRLWQHNPHHPGLDFKRVGRKCPAYSVRIGIGWRALGFRQRDTIVWFWIGSHAGYERLIKRL
ncbi:MAG: hypothetical protein NTW87_13180 [Planctomycetota bacterium]|nr:hypothetical protein [Planctomycetota bacterium]